MYHYPRDGDDGGPLVTEFPAPATVSNVAQIQEKASPIDDEKSTVWEKFTDPFDMEHLEDMEDKNTKSGNPKLGATAIIWLVLLFFIVGLFWVVSLDCWRKRRRGRRNCVRRYYGSWFHTRVVRVVFGRKQPHVSENPRVAQPVPEQLVTTDGADDIEMGTFTQEHTQELEEIDITEQRPNSAQNQGSARHRPQRDFTMSHENLLPRDNGEGSSTRPSQSIDLTEIARRETERSMPDSSTSSYSVSGTSMVVDIVLDNGEGSSTRPTQSADPPAVTPDATERTGEDPSITGIPPWRGPRKPCLYKATMDRLSERREE